MLHITISFKRTLQRFELLKIVIYVYFYGLIKKEMHHNTSFILQFHWKKWLFTSQFMTFGLFVSLLSYVLSCILKIAPGSCQIPVNHPQFWNANCPWFPPAYFKAWRLGVMSHAVDCVLQESNHATRVLPQFHILHTRLMVTYLK